MTNIIMKIIVIKLKIINKMLNNKRYDKNDLIKLICKVTCISLEIFFIFQQK